MSRLFDELMESVQEMNEILRGEREPSREFHVDSMRVKEIRKATGLTQAKFAAGNRARTGVHELHGRRLCT